MIEQSVTVTDLSVGDKVRLDGNEYRIHRLTLLPVAVETGSRDMGLQSVHRGYGHDLDVTFPLNREVIRTERSIW